MSVSYRIISTIAFLIVATVCNSQTYQWVKKIGSTSGDYCNSLITDAAGNVYVTGKFEGTVDFDPSASTANLISAGSSDIYVAKYDGLGNYVWAFRMGNVVADAGNYITLDRSGDLIVTGSFQGNADFDPSGSVLTLSALAYDDVFIAKYSPAGALRWAINARGLGYDFGYGIATDDDKNIFVTGRFTRTSDFDPSAGTANLASVNNSIDAFVAAYDSSGNFKWAGNIGGKLTDFGYGIAVSNSGDVFVSGHYQDTCDFDPSVNISTAISKGQSDIFIVKLNSLGSFVWAKSVGGDQDDNCNAMSIDASANIYIAGKFSDTADFNPALAVNDLISNGGTDIYFASYDSSGNYRFANGIGGTSLDKASGIRIAGHNLYLTGSFDGTADFDPSTGTSNLTATSIDAFIARYTLSGNLVWAKNVGGANQQESNSISASSGNTVYFGGFFFGNSNFDGNALSSAGSADAYFARYQDNVCSSTSSNISTVACNSYSGPSGQSWTSSGVYSDTITNTAGCDSIITINLTIKNSTTSSLSVNACNSYVSPSGNYTWSISGTYSDTLQNAAGCDSVMSINLTVTSIDTSVTQSGLVLSSDQSGASYQWLDCNNSFAILNGESGQSFTAVSDGNYAVQISLNNCTDTSSCFNIIGTVAQSQGEIGKFSLFPNPAKNEFYIQIPEQNDPLLIEILGLDGRLHYTMECKSGGLIPVQFGESKGIYVVRIKSMNSLQAIKLVIE